MGDYVKRDKQHPRDGDIHALLMRLIKNTQNSAPTAPVNQPNIDPEQLADIVSKAVAGSIENNLKNLSTSVYNQEKGLNTTDSRRKSYEDEFDASQAMSRLADSMTVQRGNSTSNFEGLGGTNTTKKDAEETQSTIDLLKDLDD